MRIPYVPSCTHDLQAQNHDHRRRRVVASSSGTLGCTGHDYPPSFPLLHVLRVVSMHKSMNLDDTTTSPHQRHRVDLLHARHIYTATQECAFTAALYGPPNEPDAAVPSYNCRRRVASRSRTLRQVPHRQRLRQLRTCEISMRFT